MFSELYLKLPLQKAQRRDNITNKSAYLFSQKSRKAVTRQPPQRNKIHNI